MHKTSCKKQKGILQVNETHGDLFEMYCVKIEFGKEGPITREMFFMFQPNTAENQTVPERPG